jgi:hypothetical protein
MYYVITEYHTVSNAWISRPRGFQSTFSVVLMHLHNWRRLDSYIVYVLVTNVKAFELS